METNETPLDPPLRVRILQNIFSYQLHSSDLAIVKMLKAGSEF